MQKQELQLKIRVTGKFACNKSLLNRKQTWWNILKSETVRTNPNGLQPIKIDY